MENLEKKLSYRFPLMLGSPLRTPHFAWTSWEIKWRNNTEFAALVVQSEDTYKAEWNQTTKANHDEIARASLMAGLKDANKSLNEKTATVAKDIIALNSKVQIEILDVGAGAGSTTLAVWDQLCPEDRQRSRWYLLDPSKGALSEAERAVEMAGLPREQLELIPKCDLDTFPLLINRFDLILAVSSIHHHAFLEPVMNGLARSLKVGGHLIIGDWFNGLSLHPAMILNLLKKMSWEGKEDDLVAFKCQYPASTTEYAPVLSEVDRQADEQIMAFWQAYSNVVESSESSFCILEGHRRIKHYIADLKRTGLHIPSRLPRNNRKNPNFILPNSSLLGILMAEKLQSCL